MFRAHVPIIRRAKLYYTASGIITPIGGRPVHGMATYRCDDTRCCIIQFCPPDDEHICSKHIEAWNKLIINFSASSWLILRNKWFSFAYHSLFTLKYLSVEWKEWARERLCRADLTLTLLTWRIEWVPNNASRWQMGFNSAFKGLNCIGASLKLYRGIT